MSSSPSLVKADPGTVGITADARSTVVVTARLQLIAQAVGAALRGRGVKAEPRAWEHATRSSRTADVLVVLDDLDSVSELEATCALVSKTPAHCVILTRRPAGPAWGALLAAGAAAVRTPDGSLEEMATLVARVARGESATDEDRSAELVDQWEKWRAENERLRARVARLSPREQQILVLLSEGTGVADIIRALGVAEATVRSQIKSLRRKLEVDSQLGAVAVLHRLGDLVAVKP